MVPDHPKNNTSYFNHIFCDEHAERDAERERIMLLIEMCQSIDRH